MEFRFFKHTNAFRKVKWNTMITFLFRTTNTSLSLSFTFSFPSFVHKLMKSTTKKLNYQVSLLRPRINVARGGSRIEKMDNSSTKNSTLFMRYENYYSNEKLFLFFFNNHRFSSILQIQLTF